MDKTKESISRDVRLPRDGGIPPVRSFLANDNVFIINSEVIVPDNLFCSKLRYVNFGQADMLAGMSPVNELLKRDSTFRRNK